MELDEFVRTTLQQILRGVRDAQEEAEALGAVINPRHGAGKFGNFHSSTGTYVQNVEFDVALSVAESNSSNAGLRVGVPWIGGAVDGASDRRHSAENRVRFTVPILLPSKPEN